MKNAHQIRQRWIFQEGIALRDSILEHLFANKSLEGTSFRFKDSETKFPSDLQGFDFSRREFVAVDLGESDLTGADFSGANFSKSDFSFAKLDGADFMQCKLEEAIFSGNDSLYDVRFVNANLKDAYFGFAKLVGCDFSQADLTQTNFYKAELLGVNFKNTNKEVAYFDGTIWKDS